MCGLSLAREHDIQVPWIECIALERPMVVTTGTAATSLLALNLPWLMLVLMSEELVTETPELLIAIEAAFDAAVIDQERKGLFVDSVLGAASQMCARVKPIAPPKLVRVTSFSPADELIEGTHLIDVDEARSRAIDPADGEHQR